jgi:hypothetical protein
MPDPEPRVPIGVVGRFQPDRPIQRLGIRRDHLPPRAALHVDDLRPIGLWQLSRPIHLMAPHDDHAGVPPLPGLPGFGDSQPTRDAEVPEAGQFAGRKLGKRAVLDERIWADGERFRAGLPLDEDNFQCLIRYPLSGGLDEVRDEEGPTQGRPPPGPPGRPGSA